MPVPVDMEVGLVPGDFMLDGDQPTLQKGANPQFSANVYCGQTAGCIRIPLSIRRWASAQATLC